MREGSSVFTMEDQFFSDEASQIGNAVIDKS